MHNNLNNIAFYMCAAGFFLMQYRIEQQTIKQQKQQKKGSVFLEVAF